MFKSLLMVLLLAVSAISVAESPYDTYNHATECPENGQDYENRLVTDSNSFIRCQCVSYVAEKLSDLLTVRYYNNGAPDKLAKDFQNGQYYMPQSLRKWPNGPNSGEAVTRWSHALYWRDSARYAGIGFTGAWDHFTWEEGSYNAVFKGDVAWWDAWEGNEYGHVAFVEDVQQDVPGAGVACVVVSDYNMREYTFDKRTLCKSTHSDTDSKKRFPDAFLHIDKDHAYCVIHPDTDNCKALWGGKMVASAGGKMDGLGGGSDNFNLKINKFWVVDGTGATLVSGVRNLHPGEAVTVKSQTKAVNGNTSGHMRPGKDRIEVDLYRRQGLGDWSFLKRDYIQAVNLPSGGTHTENAAYTIPDIVGKDVSFKVKIDAEDESYEANEGDNWSDIKTFRVTYRQTFFGTYEFWYDGQYYGSRLTALADVDGDGKSDLVVVNDNDVSVKRSTGTSFGSSETWYVGGYYGSRGTYLADVDGDNKADLIVVNDGDVSVKRSTGTSFGSSETWFSGGYYGSRGTYLADVDGDGMSDLVVVNTAGVSVALSTGNSFVPKYPMWTEGGYWGDIATAFADVDADGRADAIVVNYNGIVVRRSTGSSFGLRETWIGTGYYGTRATVFPDVTGDGRADALALNDDPVVRASTGSIFGSYEFWTGNPYYGNVGTYYADVDGDGSADAVVINTDGIVVRKATH